MDKEEMSRGRGKIGGRQKKSSYCSSTLGVSLKSAQNTKLCIHTAGGLDKLNTVLNSQVRLTGRYSPLRGLTSSSCKGLWPLANAFFALWAKKELFLLFVLVYQIYDTKG